MFFACENAFALVYWLEAMPAAAENCTQLFDPAPNANAPYGQPHGDKAEPGHHAPPPPPSEYTTPLPSPAGRGAGRFYLPTAPVRLPINPTYRRATARERICRRTDAFRAERRRRMDARKKRARPGKKPPERARKMVTIPADLARRLSAYAGWHGTTESAVVTELLEERLSGVYLAERGVSDTPAKVEPPLPRLADAV